ncbi:MAG: MBL fold metallo-hydrolase [Mariprofundaceae bacterium]
MLVRFRGVRGSIPSPGERTVRYGGNTTCIEIWSDNGELIILDAGTGIFPLSQSLLKKIPLHAHIFNTHSHWDHIQGLPFFIPLFVPDNEVSIYGAYDPITQNGIQEILSEQLQFRFFPIRECELNARIYYHSLRQGEQVSIGDITVTPVLMNHPVTNFGYRVECNGKSLFFTGDHEPSYNIYASQDDEFEMYASLIEERDHSIIEGMRGVDVLIADSSYTNAEYPAKKGWGHGTFESCLSMAEQAGIQQLFHTHHEPTRSDDELESILKDVLAKRKYAIADINLAREGLSLEW